MHLTVTSDTVRRNSILQVMQKYEFYENNKIFKNSFFKEHLVLHNASICEQWHYCISICTYIWNMYVLKSLI